MTIDFFAPEDDKCTINVAKTWSVLVVDDDKEVHEITKFALQDFEVDGGSLNIFSVYSGAEAIEFLKKTDDRNIAVILLDVVMETHKAGLEVAKFVREKLDNHLTRIILRTGQPADIPEKQIVLQYDINDYKAKAELTYSRLFITMVTSLRAYSELINRKNREIELAESKNQLEKANKTKDIFIARMSHELLTPLNAIIGFSQIQQMNVQTSSKEIDAELSEDILMSSYHLKMLVDDMLDLVTYKKVSHTLKLAVCDVNKIINESRSLVSILAKQKNITITYKQTDLRVLAHHDRLKQCLVNLLTNAIKFNHRNGKVLITVQIIAPQRVKISVEDNGVGIGKDDQAIIFEKFSRLEYAEKQEIQGIGVGLTLIKQLVEQMNGEVGLISELEKGSTFWLQFPEAEG